MRPRKPVTTPIRVRIVTIALCGILLTALAPAQGDDSALDPKTAAAVAATTKVLEEAQTKLGLANLALQDRYAALATAWVRVRDGQDEAFVADLTRVLADPIQEARRAGPRRAERSFAKALPKALKKAEHDLLVTLEPVMEKVGLETFAQVLSQLEDLTAQDFAETLKASVFPEGRDLYVVWNESLAETVEEAQAFVAAEAARQKIADEIMVLRDPRSAYSLGAPPGMARIPKSSVTIEATEGFKRKRRTARVKEFYIDLREVTHGDYWSKFYVHLESKAEKAAYLPRYIDQREGEKSLWYPDGETGEYLPLPDQMLLPVSGVDWSAAQAYAASQGKRLPTEAEWIAAFASAPGKNEAYPWGNAYIEGLAVDKKAGVSAPLAAEGRLAGRSAFGIYDLSGNVKEWTSTSSEGKDFETVDDIPRGENVCIRGGSYDSNPDSISSGWRWEVPATGSRLADLGFRCAMDAD